MELTKAVKRRKWDEMIQFQQTSMKLLEATLDMNEKGVAAEMEKIHSDYTSVIQYNDENSLSSVLTDVYKRQEVWKLDILCVSAESQS